MPISSIKQSNLNRLRRRNPDGRSHYVPNEAMMHHMDRKSFKLPCGYTVAQSWAALKKGWRGFKIAHSKDDLQKMKEYAKIIRKLQLQMGIRAHAFDEDVLSLQEQGELFLENCHIEWTCDKEETNVQEREPDYEEVTNSIPLPEPIPGPRNEIFASSQIKVQKQKQILNPNSCLTPPVDSTANVVLHKKSSHSCPSQHYPGGATVEKRIFMNNCPSQPCINGSVHERQIEKRTIDNEFRNTINSPKSDEQSEEDNISLAEDDTKFENQFGDFPDYQVNEYVGQNHLPSAREDRSFERDDYAIENNFQVKVTHYVVRKGKSCEYPSFEHNDNE